ncbi:ABC transporter ATP-binding protein [Phaeobacter sp. C3_T13_0]|uniref:ABC transporter ATP-binding protein n=1 Tax=Phaeobacter cretensis TaxID=3342641 RepID=UPI0039BD6099
MNHAAAPLLEVDNLRVSYPTPKGRVEVVKGLSFTLGRERLGIVGESGSGKSMTGRAILRLIRNPGQMAADKLALEGQDLQGLNDRQMRGIRGARISMIMQDPKFSLNPVMTIGAQIAESLDVHERLSRRDTNARVLDMLGAVRINDPKAVARMYPHQVSGGMGQRVMIAMMLIPRPDLLIADEPTSALDVSVQAQVLDLIDELVRAKGMGLILISHDLNLVARYCDRIMVMNGGQVVESCAAGDLHKASHPYTQGLLAAVPQMKEIRDTLPVLDRQSWSRT